MFNRLVEAKFPNKLMLSTQYRMHDYLLKVPNVLFYDNKIESGYKNEFENLFLNREKPMLFIDCNTVEQRYGSSYSNEEESLIVLELVKYLCNKMKYDKNKFGFVSPYQG